MQPLKIFFLKMVTKFKASISLAVKGQMCKYEKKIFQEIIDLWKDLKVSMSLQDT